MVKRKPDDAPLTVANQLKKVPDSVHAADLFQRILRAVEGEIADRERRETEHDGAKSA